LRGDENEAFFFKAVHKIRKRNIAKITPNFDFPHNHLFSSIKPENILNTTVGWIYRFNKAIENTNNWDVLLSISEKGRFLNNKQDLLKGKKVELVLSSSDINEFEDLKDKNFISQDNLLSGQLNFLPWWLHNRHMVLFLKRTNKRGRIWRDRWKMVEGFFYESRMLSRRVNPVHLKGNREDLESLLYIFVNYWYRAKEYTRQQEGPGRNVPIISDEEGEMEGLIEELLGFYVEKK
jgi:hypothetical protein